MKRTIVLILLAAMLVSLTACGSKSNEKILGVYSADSHTYDNEFIGIGCKLDTEWDVFDEAGIAELNGMLADAMTDKTIADQLESSGYVQPFYAQKQEGLVTVNITVENLGVLYGSVLDEKGYAEQSVDQIAPTLEALGLTNVTAKIGTVSFAGSEHVAIFVSASLQGVDFYETAVCVKVDRYIACITAGSYMTDTTGDVLSMFYGL